MTAQAFIDGEHYDIGEAQCPDCGYPAIGYFQDGKLDRVELSVGDPCLESIARRADDAKDHVLARNPL